MVSLPLLLILLGIFESSLMYWSWQALQGAAIDAGRCAGLNVTICGNPTTSVTATQNYAVTAAQIRGLGTITTSNVTVLTGASAQTACGSTTATVVDVQMTYKFPMIAFIPLPSNLTASACFPLAS